MPAKDQFNFRNRKIHRLTTAVGAVAYSADVSISGKIRFFAVVDLQMTSAVTADATTIHSGARKYAAGPVIKLAG